MGMSPTHKMLTCIYLAGMLVFLAGVQTAENNIDVFHAMMILYPLYGIVIGYSWAIYYGKPGKRWLIIYSIYSSTVMLSALGLVVADMRGIPLYYSWIPFLAACVIAARHLVRKYKIVDKND